MMTPLRRSVLPLVVLLLALGACSSDKEARSVSSTSRPAGTQSTARTPTACSADTAKPRSNFTVGGRGFAVTCGRIKRGTNASFINVTDRQVEVSLAKRGPDRFNAQLPHNGSTFTHLFKTAGTYVVTSKPKSTLTLFVVE